MKTYELDASDAAAIAEAARAITERTANPGNVTMIIGGDVADFAARAEQQEGAGPGRLVIWLKTAASNVLGDREPEWFGADGACAVALRGREPRETLKATANAYQINHAFLSAEVP